MAAATRQSENRHESDANHSSARPGQEPEASAEKTDGGETADVVEQELQRRFAEAIEPVIANVPEQFMAAIQPALQQLEESMAHVVHQKAQDVLALEMGTQSEQNHESRGVEGNHDMPTRNSQTKRQTSRAKGDDEQEDSAENQDNSQARKGQRSQRPTYAFDAAGAARVGLLNLANAMRDYGAIYQAIGAYERILTRYPGTGAADIATEELVNLAGRLQKEGKIYTALNIFNKLEQYV